MGNDRLVLGVDGGNSKTIALVGHCDGTIVGWGRAGNSDLYGAASESAAIRSLDEAVGAALHMAGAGGSLLRAATFSMAGADWPEDVRFLRRAIRRRGIAGKLLVVNDALGALRAGSPDWTGVVVVCGTGAATGARAAGGRTWHSGWWQEPQGSRHLGEKGLRAVYRSELGIDPPTSLTRRVLEIFECETVDEVLHARTVRKGPRADKRDEVARALLQEADAGDDESTRIVRDHGLALGDHAAAAAREVGIAMLSFTLVLAGGVFRHSSSLLAESLVGRVRESCPKARPVRSRFEPAVGALFLALEMAGTSVEDRVLQRLLASLPDQSYFAT